MAVYDIIDSASNSDRLGDRLLFRPDMLPNSGISRTWHNPSPPPTSDGSHSTSSVHRSPLVAVSRLQNDSITMPDSTTDNNTAARRRGRDDESEDTPSKRKRLSCSGEWHGRPSRPAPVFWYLDQLTYYPLAFTFRPLVHSLLPVTAFVPFPVIYVSSAFRALHSD